MVFSRTLLSVLLVASALAAQQKPGGGAVPSKPAGDSQIYRNSTFGFRYRTPYGWVDRAKDLKEVDEQKTAQSSKPGAQNGEVLLAVFERPPQAAGEAVNSAVVIASESAAAYPGLKSAEDYLGPLNEITTSKGFKPDGDPQEVEIAARTLIRADFTKTLNDKLTMYQSTLVMLEKKQIVSFTFIAGSKDEVDGLIDALDFADKAGRKAK